MILGYFLCVVMIIVIYIATGLAVAAGSWDGVLRRNPVFPQTKAGLVGLVLREAARWPVTLIEK